MFTIVALQLLTSNHLCENLLQALKQFGNVSFQVSLFTTLQMQLHTLGRSMVRERGPFG